MVSGLIFLVHSVLALSLVFEIVNPVSIRVCTHDVHTLREFNPDR